jgi:branched-subunit amino acid ABC-type transport system permease component
MSDILDPGSLNGILLLLGSAALALIFGLITLIAFFLGHRRTAGAALVLAVLNPAMAVLGDRLTDAPGPWHDSTQPDWIDFALLPWFFLCLLAFWWLRRLRR